MAISRPRIKVVILLGAITLLAVMAWRARGVRPEPYIFSQVSILHTDWVAQVRSLQTNNRFDYGGGVDLRLLNTSNGETLQLARGSQVEDAKLESHIEGELDITIPNRTDVEFLDASKAKVKVVYHFTPFDDPEDRRSFFRWHNDWYSEENRAWYCKTIVPNYKEPALSVENRSLGQVTGRERYCPELPAG